VLRSCFTPELHRLDVASWRHAPQISSVRGISSYAGGVEEQSFSQTQLPTRHQPSHFEERRGWLQHATRKQKLVLRDWRYSSWGKGVATVADGPTGRSCQVDFEYKFYDRYNWDAGKSVTFAGVTVTDKFMGEFHRQGIAKEYDCNGSFKRRFTWTKGQRIAQAQLDAPGGR